MLRWVDVSRYQVERSNPLDLVKARDDGYSIVNVALTGGRGYVSGSWAKSYLDAAAVLGMGRSCYHWLDGRTPGKLQAQTQLTRMAQLFGKNLGGFAHCVDIEETGEHGITPPGWQTVVDYVNAMQDTLGRHVVIYSGDHYWQPRGWPGSTLTPYVMGMPNAGPLPAYPGDTSGHWTAGWGGWSKFAIMQWGVAPLPGTGDCSLSVIRDPAVWAAITGGTGMAWENTPASVSLVNEFDTVSPGRSRESDGTIGDQAHAQNVSDHNPDETGNTGGVEDADNVNEVHARDVTAKGPWPAGWSMERFVQLILARCRAKVETRLRYIIFNRRIWKLSTGWVEEVYTGTNPHDKHAHFSFRYGSGPAPTNPEQVTTPWGIVAAVRTLEDTVSAADVIAALKDPAGQTALVNALFGTDAGRAAFRDMFLRTNGNTFATGQPPYSLGGMIGDSVRRVEDVQKTRLPALTEQLTTLRTDVLAALSGAGGGPAADITPELLADALEIALRRVFGTNPTPGQ